MTQQSPIYFKRYLAIPFVRRNCFPFLQSVQLIGLQGVAALRDRHVGFENERMTKIKRGDWDPVLWIVVYRSFGILSANEW